MLTYLDPFERLEESERRNIQAIAENGTTTRELPEGKSCSLAQLSKQPYREGPCLQEKPARIRTCVQNSECLPASLYIRCPLGYNHSSAPAVQVSREARHHAPPFAPGTQFARLLSAGFFWATTLRSSCPSVQRNDGHPKSIRSWWPGLPRYSLVQVGR